MSLWPALKLLSYFKVMNDALSYSVTGVPILSATAHILGLSAAGAGTQTQRQPSLNIHDK